AEDADDGAAGSADHDDARAAPGADPAASAPQSAAPANVHAAASAPRGAPQTVANLAAQIVKKLEAKTTRFDVELDPAGLGKVNVRVDISADGQISAALACHNPHAAEALKARSNELRQALEQAGFDLSGGLSFEMAGGQNGGAGAGQGQFDNQPGASFRGRAFANALETADGAAQAAADSALRYGSSRTSGVDIRI
ncbi:flagellar hook-length control protein FliK, partial [Phenylobacterium soli]